MSKSQEQISQVFGDDQVKVTWKDENTVLINTKVGSAELTKEYFFDCLIGMVATQKRIAKHNEDKQVG